MTNTYQALWGNYTGKTYSNPFSYLGNNPGAWTVRVSKNGSGSSPSDPLPDLSSLPRDKCVVVFKYEDIDEVNDIRPWSREIRIKYYWKWALVDGKVARVFVLKKKKDVVMFKLKWG